MRKNERRLPTSRPSSPEGDGWSHGFDCYADLMCRELTTNLDQIEMIENNPDAEDLDEYTKENWEKMGAFICSSERLKKIVLNNCWLLAEEDITLLFGREGPYKCPLIMLGILSCGVRLAELTALLPFIKSMTGLCTLNLIDNFLGDREARLLAEALDHIRIRNLLLDRNELGDDGIESILTSANSRYLTLLSLVDNDDFGSRGIDAISRFVQKEDTMLEEIILGSERNKTLHVECTKSLIQSLVSNSTLRTISLDYFIEFFDQDEISIKTFEVICNKSSFNAFCQSNHTFEGVNYRYEGVHYRNIRMEVRELNPPLRTALEINSDPNTSINKKLRCKFELVCFLGDFDIEPFLSMEPTLMPNVLELVTMSKNSLRNGRHACPTQISTHIWQQNGDLNGVYRFIRNWNLPDLLRFPSPESKKMKQLEEEIARLKQFEAENIGLKRDIARLASENERLVSENEELHLKSGKCRTSARNNDILHLFDKSRSVYQ